MELEFLGTGNAFSRTKGPSCAILRYEGHSTNMEILIDAGEGVTELVCNEIEKGNLWLNKEVHIMITHTHPDHVAGIGNLIYELRYRYDIKTFHIAVGCELHKREIENILTIFGIYKNQHQIHINIIEWEPVEENPPKIINERRHTEEGHNVESTTVTLEFKHVPHDGAKPCFGIRAITTKHIEDTSKEVSELSTGIQLISKEAILYSGDTSRFFGYAIDSIGDDIIMKDVTNIKMYHEASISDSPLHTHISKFLRDANNYNKNFFPRASKEFILYHLPDDIIDISQLEPYGDIDSLNIKLAETKKGMK